MMLTPSFQPCFNLSWGHLQNRMVRIGGWEGLIRDYRLILWCGWRGCAEQRVDLMRFFGVYEIAYKVAVPRRNPVKMSCFVIGKFG